MIEKMPLLDLTRVHRANDNNQALFNVNADVGAGTGTVYIRGERSDAGQASTVN